MEEARELYEHALWIHREVGNRGNEGIVLGDLATVTWTTPLSLTPAAAGVAYP
jgi:hypothetical protein